MRLIVTMIAVAFCVFPNAKLAVAENYAFLVAVQDYNVKSLKPLRFTRNDIEQFSKILQTSGFKAENIVMMTDKSEDRRLLSESEKIRKQFDLLLAGVEENDTLVVAFAGHGVQFEGDEKNYFCPADADLEDPKHLRLVAMSEIYDRLKSCPAHRKLLVVDACRKDPRTELARSRETIKLKSVTRPQTEPVPKGVVALFSCAAGQEAFEWPEYKHGIFFHHFLEGWSGAAAGDGQQVTLDQVVAYAKQKTQTFARVNLEAPQTPQLKSEFEGTWVLKTLARLDSTKSKPQPLATLPPPRQEPPTSSSIPGTGKGDRSFSGNSSFTGRNNSSPANLRSPYAPKRATNVPDNYQTRVTSSRNGLSHFEIRDAEIRHTNGLGQEIWKIRPQFPDDAIPNGLRLGDKHVYVRDSDGKVHKLDRQTGELLGSDSP